VPKGSFSISVRLAKTKCAKSTITVAIDAIIKKILIEDLGL
jgi:hypothetical protein